MTLGVDVGGTFTDVALWDGDRLRTAKASTATNQSDSVLEGCREVTDHDDVLLHGTTVATNALLERRGARTALITDDGFTDVIEIARQDRPSLYDVFADRPSPLVPRAGRFAAGDASTLVEDLRRYEPESIAVSLLHAYRDGGRERDIAAALADTFPVPISLSHAVVGEFREFERTSTTILNAYLTPAVAQYLRALELATADAGLANRVEVIRSSGGLMSLAGAQALPAAVLLSGPAAGVVAAAALGRSLGIDELVSFDMGGTSTDVCRIVNGQPDVTYERAVDGFACRMPSVAVHTVGAGGGSVAWRDTGGALRVGPTSAGAWPGPAAYGRGGTLATVTDANVVLGRFDGHRTLAGGLALHRDAAHDVTAILAAELDLPTDAAAWGMLQIVEAHMERAIRGVSVEQGADPRGASLVSFGGAGGLHATALARALGMNGVFIPPHCGVFSALGLLMSPQRADAARSTHLTSTAGLDELLDEVATQARQALTATATDVRLLVDVRYIGQAHETTIDIPTPLNWDSITTRFHEAHAQRNGFARRDDPIEIVTVRAEATAPAALRWDDLPAPTPDGDANRGTIELCTPQGTVEAQLVRRAGLAEGAEIVGPAIVTEDHATTHLAADERAKVDASGTLVVEW
jgi:N-methylhydantoinase A